MKREMEERPSLDAFTVCIDQCRALIEYNRTDLNFNIDRLIKELNKGVLVAEKLGRNILISKTTGTSVGAIGGVLCVIGVALISFTAGISGVVLSSIGGRMSILGGETSLTSSIVELCLERTQAQHISKLLENFKILLDCYPRKVLELEELKEVQFKYIKLASTVQASEFEITDWLRNGYLHQDEDVKEDDLRTGDHIFRRIKYFPLNYHHGIYINDNKVVEVTEKKGITLRSITEFKENQQLKRRQYRGYDLEVEETIRLVKEAMEHVEDSHQYNIFTNNCEHFATSMKLKVRWSGQVHAATKYTSAIGKNIPRPISLILEGVETGTQLSLAIAPNVSKRIFSFFKSAPVPIISNVAKVAMVLTPIGIAVDVTSLVFDFKKENASVETCKKVIVQLEKEKSCLKENNGYLKELMQFLIERHQELIEEDERKKLRELEEVERQRRCYDWGHFAFKLFFFTKPCIFY